MKTVKTAGMLIMMFTFLLGACSNSEPASKEDDPKESEETTENEESAEDEQKEGSEEADEGQQVQEQEADDNNAPDNSTDDSDIQVETTENNPPLSQADSAVVDDFYLYMEFLNQAVVYEQEALTTFNQLITSQADDVTAADTIYYEVIPAFENYLVELENIPLQTSEITALNDELINLSYYQYEAFFTIVDGLDLQDETLLNEGFLMMEEHKAMSEEFLYRVADVAAQYGIPYDLELALESL